VCSSHYFCFRGKPNLEGLHDHSVDVQHQQAQLEVGLVYGGTGTSPTYEKHPLKGRCHEISDFRFFNEFPPSSRVFH
jgi:hypothetical protein